MGTTCYPNCVFRNCQTCQEFCHNVTTHYKLCDVLPCCTIYHVLGIQNFKQWSMCLIRVQSIDHVGFVCLSVLGGHVILVTCQCQLFSVVHKINFSVYPHSCGAYLCLSDDIGGGTMYMTFLSLGFHIRDEKSL